MTTFINLRISGTAIDLQEITEQLPIPPVNTGKKGDVVMNRSPLEKRTVIQEDFWIGEHRFDENASLEENLECFLIRLRASAAFLKFLSKKHDVTIWVSAYPETEQANMHISVEAINILSEIGATLDCSMAFLKDFYDGIY